MQQNPYGEAKRLRSCNCFSSAQPHANLLPQLDLFIRAPPYQGPKFGLLLLLQARARVGISPVCAARMQNVHYQLNALATDPLLRTLPFSSQNRASNSGRPKSSFLMFRTTPSIRSRHVWCRNAKDDCRGPAVAVSGRKKARWALIRGCPGLH